MKHPCPYTTYHLDGMVFDCGRKLLLGVDGKPMALTAAEMRLLGILVASWPEFASRREVFEEVVRRPYAKEDRSFDQLVFSLRRKLPRDAHGRWLIETDRTFGYSLVVPVRAETRAAA